MPVELPASVGEPVALRHPCPKHDHVTDHPSPTLKGGIPPMEARSIHEAAGADVIAVGDGAREAKSADVSLLGYLVWFSVSEMEVGRDDLLGATLDSGLGERFAPGEISPRDAFRRATSSLGRSRVPVLASASTRLFGDEKRHANLLVRDVRTNGDNLIRQLVREVVDSKGATLAHEAVVQFELSPTGKLRIFVKHRPLLAQEEEIVAEAGAAFEKAKVHHDSGAVRRTVSCALSECSPVALRASGGVYFVPRSHEAQVRAVERFVGELKDRIRGKDAASTRVRSSWPWNSPTGRTTAT
jgi:hypothetical protein